MCVNWKTGVAGVDVVVVSIGKLLLSELTERHWFCIAYDRPDCVICSERTRSDQVEISVG